MSNDQPKTKTLSIAGTRLLLDGQPFPFQGLSFFNALYNPTFNASPEARDFWLRKFLANGVNALRVWCQWDFDPPRTYVDVAPEHTLYTEQGAVREAPFLRLAELLVAADRLGMVLEVVLFSQEHKPYLPVEVHRTATRQMVERLKPYRNLILQIWNEELRDVYECCAIAKSVDPARIVTNSPGVANVLGDDAQNTMLDLLTPHTVRGSVERFWEVAPAQLAGLLAKFNKPVIDDEPARNGLVQFGGIPGGTRPAQHIAQIEAVRRAGCYHLYHHDMFQRSYGDPATPPTGIPDPDFSPFHRQVFDYLQAHTRF